MTRTQLNRLISLGTAIGPSQVAAAIATAPVVAAVLAGSAVTYTAAAGITGIPTPTVQHDLYVNGVLTAANYVSGNYPAANAGDALVVKATATNGVGSPAVSSSATITVQAIPVLGSPVFTAQTALPATVASSYRYPYSATNTPTAWAVNSGSIPTGMTLSTTTGLLSGTPTAAGTFTFTVSATNATGTAVSTTQTIVASYVPVIAGIGVVGKALSYTIPGFAGTIVSQQWRKNPGTGAVAVSGATGATWSPVSGDAGAYPSVRVLDSLGNTWTSTEFATTNAVMSQTDVLSTTSPNAGFAWIGSEATAVTAKTVLAIRMMHPGTPADPRYIDTIIAPGSYAGTTANFGNLGVSIFSCSNYIKGPLSSGPIIAPIADTTAATDTRPVIAGQPTGTGFFTKNGQLYDVNGHKFKIRGVNRVHWDSASLGVWNTGANAHRIFLDFTQTWATNKALLDAMITTAHSVVPIPCLNYCKAKFNGTISGNTLTVISMTAETIGVGASGQGCVISAGGGVAACTILSQLTNTNGSGIPGKEGTYTISGAAQTVASSTPMTAVMQTTGNSTPALLAAVVQSWVDQVANFGLYDRYSIINIANEWGPAASATNTVWRDAYILAVQKMRTAGYLGTLMINAPGSGQDSYALLNHAAAVLAADPQHNCCFDLHLYSNAKPGNFMALAKPLSDLATSSGMVFLIGEFGPGRNIGPSPSIADPLEILATCEALPNIGWLPWAWDDNNLGGGLSNDGWFAMTTNNSTGYQTSNAAELTTFGKAMVLDPVYGLSVIATPASIF